MERHHLALIQAAQRLGISYTDLSEQWATPAVRFSHGGREQLVLDGRVFTGMSLLSDWIAIHKQACKTVLAELGISIPVGLCFEDACSPEVDDFLRMHAPVVCKPRNGAEGEGVLMAVHQQDHVQKHCEQFLHYGEWMLEEQVQGRDLRIQAIGGKLVAACIRVPCTVTGDGLSTIRQLIDVRNEALKVHNPDNHIDLDDQTFDLLRQAGCTLDSILSEGRVLTIKKVANISQGGHAIDVTERLHPKYFEWIEAIASRLEMNIFSLDVIAADESLDPGESAWALEINSRASWLHHTFTERQTHDIPALILRELFELGPTS